MQLTPVISADQAVALSQQKLPVLAIDLGFATSSKSCGLSGDLGNLTFSHCVRATGGWLDRNGRDSATVLILEAPLSASFDKAGNPTARAAFEREYEQTNQPSDRRWHVGAGAAMSLAALYFLSQLLQGTVLSERPVYLVEGFVSRYDNRQKPSHRQVAEALSRAWNTQAWRNGGRAAPQLVYPTKGTNSTVRSTLSFLQPAACQSPPLILRLPDNLSGESIDSLYR